MKDAPSVLVLGGSGRVGRLLAGAQSGAPQTWHWQGRRAADGIDWVCDPMACAIQDLAAGLQERGVSTVLVLWGVVPAGSGEDPELNVILANRALDAARAAGVPHVILASSIAVYGSTLATGQAVSEATPALATAGYGGAKLRMEQMAAEFCTSHARTAPGVTILRLANVLGADQLSRAILKEAPVTLDQFSDGCGPKRSYLAPGTFVQAVKALAESPPRSGQCEVFNLADSSHGYDMSEIVSECQKQGMETSWTWRTAGAGALPIAQMSVTAIESRLPFLGSVQKPDAAGLVADWKQAREAQV